MDNIIDPFKDIDLDNLKKNKKKHATTEQQKESIKDIAVSNDFFSRNTQAKQKTITKTFSLFKEECLLINEAISEYNNLDNNFTAVSGSDIVRAALYSFSKLSDEEKHNLITKHRGRGR